MDIKGKKNSFFVANLYTVVSIFIEKWSCWCHAYFNAGALKCHFEALSLFWLFLSYHVKKYWMGKSENAANCCYYCILHQTIAWEKLLKYCAWLSRSNKMFICWKYNQSLFYVSLYCLVWHSVVFVCSPMKVKPARKQKLEDQTMWKWQWQQSKLSFWPTTSPMIFCCSHVLCHFSVDIYYVGFLGCIGFGLHIWSLKMWCW